MLDQENEIKKQIQEIQEAEDSLKTKAKATFAFSVANFGLAFTPISLVTIPFSIGIFAYDKYLDGEKKKLKEKSYDVAINMENIKNQKEFMEKLSKLIDEHYKESFKDYNFIKEKEICKHIKLNSQNQMDSKLTGELKNQAEKLLKTQEGNHYNILILGRSGVGKSTLINVVLNLKGKDAAKENAVKPETGAENNSPAPNLQETGLVEKKKTKFVPLEYGSEQSSLILLDSRGIELSKNYSIDVAAEDIKEFIEERNGLNSNPDKFIHCVWYLVSGKRFEDGEGKYVQSLKTLYTNFGLPIIFVYTQAINEDDGDLICERIKEFMGEDINFIQIIARDMELKTQRFKTNLPAFGVFDKDGLIQKSFEFAKNAIKSSYFNYMKNLLKNIFVEAINLKAFFKAHFYIYMKIEDVIYNNKKPLEEVRNSFENDFIEIINEFLIDKEIPEYTKKNRTLIKEYFNCFPNLNDPKIIQLIDKLKASETDKYIGNYMDINLQTEKNLGIKKQQGKEEIKDMVEKGVIDPVKNRIPYIALSYILLKYMGILGDYLYKKLYEDFEESYKRIENKTSEALKNVINKVYDNIMEKSVQKKKTEKVNFFTAFD